MDEIGIDAPVLYPNSIGLGAQNLSNTIETTWLSDFAWSWRKIIGENVANLSRPSPAGA